MSIITWLNNLEESVPPLRIPKVRLGKLPGLDPSAKGAVEAIATIEVVTRLDLTNMPTFHPEGDVRGIDVLEVSFKPTSDFPEEKALTALAIGLGTLLPLNPLLILFRQPSEDNAYITACLAVPRQKGDNDVVALDIRGSWPQGKVGTIPAVEQAFARSQGIFDWHRTLHEHLLQANDNYALREEIAKLERKLSRVKGFDEQRKIRAQLMDKKAELQNRFI